MIQRVDLLPGLKTWPFGRRKHPLPPDVERYLDATRPDEQMSWREIPYSVVDVETTGLNSKRDALLSIGMVDIDHGRIQMDKHWYALLRPPEHIEVSPASIRIHGLLREDVADAPPPQEVIEELLNRLTGRVLIVHYSPIDVAFLNQALRSYWKVSLRGPAIDTMLLARALSDMERFTDALQGIGGMPHATALRILSEKAGLPVFAQHHALCDALTTAQLFLAQATRMEAFGCGSLRKFLGAARCL